MAMRETTKMEYDGLLAGGIAAFTKNVAITAGTAMKRGTLMTVTDGTAAATAATVYITGRFHREKVIAAEGDTVDAHEEELRGKGILFAALK